MSEHVSNQYVDNLDRTELIKQHLRLSVENHLLHKLLTLPASNHETSEALTPYDAKLIGQLAFDLYDSPPRMG